MTSIVKATEKDYKLIMDIGAIAVEEAHRESCSAEDMQTFLRNTYNEIAIKEELKDSHNLYHIIYYQDKAIGFSKIILNYSHPNIEQQNVTKLDRIYILKEYFDLKLGYTLLQFNIALAKENNQYGIWLFTWVDNKRAVDFYIKTGFTIIGNHKFKVTETHYNSHYQMLLVLSS